MSKIKDLFIAIWVIVLSGLYFLGCIGLAFYVAIKEKIAKLR
tara:strand:- start:381 stop:506 length:126 start_codon:yes stop_codon:yes gene_type:complete